MTLLTDKQLFCNALIAAQEQLFNELPSEDKIDIEPSKRFVKKVNKLITAQKHSYWKYINSTGKKVAIIVLACLTLFGSAMTVKAFRDPVLQFITESWESFTRIFTSETTSEKSSLLEIKTVFTISNSLIPDGFIKTYEYSDSLNCSTIWSHDTEEIILTQNLASADMTINTEGVELKEIMVKGQDAYFYTNKGTTTVVWNDGDYSFLLSYPERFTVDEIINISESLVEKND